MENADPEGVKNFEQGLEQLRQAYRAAKDAEGTCQELGKWLWENVAANTCTPRACWQLPKELELVLEKLHAELEQMRAAAGLANEAIWDLTFHKFWNGMGLKRAEYHIVAAGGMFGEGSSKTLGLSPFDDYEAFSFFCYEDGERRAYIFPEEKPRSAEDENRIRMRFGIPPEEARLDALRPEQRAFFERYLPEVYARFKH